MARDLSGAEAENPRPSSALRFGQRRRSRIGTTASANRFALELVGRDGFVGSRSRARCANGISAYISF
jgi:hypothetical protein